MFASSYDYLKALREGNYLCFLEWPAFMQQKYGMSVKEFNTDILTDCLILEWMVQGFKEEDIRHMELLYAAYELERSPLQAGKYAFCLTILMSALFSCMTLHAFQATEKWPYNEGDAQLASEFVALRVTTLSNGAFNEHNRKHREAFINSIQLLDKDCVYAVDQRINSVTRILCHLEMYIDMLKAVKTPEQGNNLLGARLALAQKLHGILGASIEFSAEINEETYLTIHNSVRAIREKQPEAWEDEYLQMLSSPTVTDTVVKIATTWIPRFFTWIGLDNYSHLETEAKSAQPKSN